MAIVEWKKDGTVAIMIMNNGENRNNPAWAEAMLSVYNEIEADEEIKALVLTSSDPKNFCLGVDLAWVTEQMQAGDFDAISRWLYGNGKVFRALMMAPFPTIAAITGHAFGNGAMLAGCCDFRFMRADRGYMCLPEIDTGIQMAPSMLEWMTTIIPDHLFKRMMLGGERISAKELEENHVIIKACENAEKTLEEAVAFAKTFQKSRNAMREMKIRAYKHITDKMENEDPEYFDNKPERAQQGQMPVFMITLP